MALQCCKVRQADHNAANHEAKAAQAKEEEATKEASAASIPKGDLGEVVSLTVPHIPHIALTLVPTRTLIGSILCYYVLPTEHTHAGAISRCGSQFCKHRPSREHIGNTYEQKDSRPLCKCYIFALRHLAGETFRSHPMLTSSACALLTSLRRWQVACHRERTVGGFQCNHKCRYTWEWEAAVAAQLCQDRQAQHSSGEQKQKQKLVQDANQKRKPNTHAADGEANAHPLKRVALHVTSTLA